MRQSVSFVIAGILLMAVSGCYHIKEQPSDSDMVFSDLATVWDEAMPLGNATLGALVWQKDSNLRISLDRIDLWDLRPVVTHIGDHFSFDWVKEHIRSGDYSPVLEKFDRPAKKYPAPSKIPGAALEFNTSGWGPVVRNRLFVKDAVCVVDWKSGIKLSTFVQADATVGWFIFENVPESFNIQLVPPQYQSEEQTRDDGLGGASLSLLGYPQGKIEREDNCITYHQEGWEGYFYDVTVKWKKRGRKIEGVWSISTSLSGDNSFEDVSNALHSGPLYCWRHHKTFWKHYWDKSSIEVPDTLLQRQYDREVYKFGSAAREDSYPISLQSVWTADDGLLPPWKGDYHHDLNTELSYWPAYSGNRLEEGLGYLNTLWNQRDNYKKFTRDYFGKDGLDVPGVCTLEGKAMGSNWVMYSLSTTTGAWLAHHFYLHWKYSADDVFLKNRAYPFLKDVATFLEQETEVRPDGIRSFEYSASPEMNRNQITAWFPEITNYDLALTRFAFLAAAEMADSLGLSDEVLHWKSLETELPDYALDEDGGLEIAPGYPYSVSHRHFSHAMAIHPLGLLDKSHSDKEKAIIDATIRRLHKNGPDWWTGYSYSWLANLEARAGHGDEAADALRTFASCFCLRNSFHANGDQTKSGKSRYTYRPFTLEGNFAFASGLQEMLIQSQSGVIEIFPAIPDNWKYLRFNNLRAIGAFLVSAEKKDGEVTSLTVYSEKGEYLRIRSPRNGEIIERQTSPGEQITII